MAKVTFRTHTPAGTSTKQHSSAFDPGIARSYANALNHQVAAHAANPQFHPQSGNRTHLHKGINPLHPAQPGVNSVPRATAQPVNARGPLIRTDR